MHWRLVLVTPLLAASSIYGQQPSHGPTNEKAQKTYREAVSLEEKHQHEWALEAFKKADKQDDGHCVACQNKIVKLGIELRDWKPAESAASELVAEAQGDREVALAHYHLARVFLSEGIDKKKDELFARAHEELTKALAAAQNFPEAIYTDGLALARMNQDDAAKARFEQFAKMKPVGEVDAQRALLFAVHPELARARMAPPFAVTTTDGQKLSLDELRGKVVLMDFWATWCGPCREALPHMKELAKKFDGQPLIVLSVSLDDDEQKWKEFISKNEMSWPQYRDGGFTGPMARLFDVKAIPHTFTIDADGVLQDEHIGDAAIEGKLKKLMARAREVEAAQKTAQAPKTDSEQ